MSWEFCGIFVRDLKKKKEYSSQDKLVLCLGFEPGCLWMQISRLYPLQVFSCIALYGSGSPLVLSGKNKSYRCLETKCQERIFEPIIFDHIKNFMVYNFRPCRFFSLNVVTRLVGGRPEFHSLAGEVKGFRHRVQTKSEANPSSYPVGTGGSLEDKAAGAWRWPHTSQCRC
jgi:hypothetical protein